LPIPSIGDIYDEAIARGKVLMTDVGSMGNQVLDNNGAFDQIRRPI
jgi:hypothetical protein